MSPESAPPALLPDPEFEDGGFRCDPDCVERCIKRELSVVSQVLVRCTKTRRVGAFAHAEPAPPLGTAVIIETERGPSEGVVIGPPTRNLASRRGLRQILGLVPPVDEVAAARQREREREAFVFCEKCIHARRLDMKLIAVDHTVGDNKAIFYFSAENRVDFRDLVRDLAHQLRIRVEMRQVGIRDEAKMVGGIGSCGRELCCSTWLTGFEPVTIKMAKTQGLVLNPQKVSGQCGRLMCCLAYEQAHYEERRRGLPRQNALVETPDGPGRIRELDVLRQLARVHLESGGERVYPATELTAVPRGAARPTDAPRDGERPPATPAAAPHARPERPRRPRAASRPDGTPIAMDDAIDAMLVGAGVLEAPAGARAGTPPIASASAKPPREWPDLPPGADEDEDIDSAAETEADEGGEAGATPESSAARAERSRRRRRGGRGRGGRTGRPGELGAPEPRRDGPEPRRDGPEPRRDGAAASARSDAEPEAGAKSDAARRSSRRRGGRRRHRPGGAPGAPDATP